MESLSAIQITNRGNRRVGNNCLLKLISGAEFHQSLKLRDVNQCCHIAFETSDCFWVSDNIVNSIILTNTTGIPLHRLEDLCSDLYNGLHTMNSKGELIYINMKYNIIKLSRDMKTTHTFMQITDSKLEQRCIY